MHWDGYTTFSVLSGITLLVCAVLPGLSVKDRLWSLGGGIGFVAYGLYVGHQTSGTWTFPAVIFVIPFGAAGYALLHVVAYVVDRSSTTSGPHAAGPTPYAPAASIWSAPVAPVGAAAPADRSARAAQPSWPVPAAPAGPPARSAAPPATPVPPSAGVVRTPTVLSTGAAGLPRFCGQCGSARHAGGCPPVRPTVTTPTSTAR